MLDDLTVTLRCLRVSPLVYTLCVCLPRSRSFLSAFTRADALSVACDKSAFAFDHSLS